jgi:translation initiation factor 5B
VNPDDEWPEEEVKPKKSKKGKKADDEPMELDEAPAASPALELAPVPVQTAVNVDDEWPEDDVKLKKGKKGNKGKKTVDGDEDDWMNGTKEEKKVDVVAAAVDETPAPALVQEVETAAVEAEVDGEPKDDGPKVSLTHLLLQTMLRIVPRSSPKHRRRS